MTERPSPLASLRAQLSVFDVVVHLSVPAVLVAAYLTIPYESLLYQPGVGGPEMVYLSLLGHADVGHLLGNVFGFLVLSGLSLLLLRVSARGRLYYACFAALLCLVAPIGALQWELTLALTTPEAVGTRGGSGFSLVTAAFLALLALSLSVHHRDVLESPSSTLLTSGGFFAGALALAVVTREPLVALTLAVVSGLALLSFARTLLRTLSNAESRQQKRAAGRSVVGVAAFGGSSVDLFVLSPASGVRPHVVGLCIGFVLVWLVVFFRR